MSGSDLAKAKEAAAQKMREKQAAGMRPSPEHGPSSAAPESHTDHNPVSSRCKEDRGSQRR